MDCGLFTSHLNAVVVSTSPGSYHPWYRTRWSVWLNKQIVIPKHGESKMEGFHGTKFFEKILSTERNIHVFISKLHDRKRSPKTLTSYSFFTFSMRKFSCSYIERDFRKCWQLSHRWLCFTRSSPLPFRGFDLRLKTTNTFLVRPLWCRSQACP